MMASINITSTARAQLPQGFKRKVEAVTSMNEPQAKRIYHGKCQYKTGKCFNERTLKRNGDAHSLCEEHRIKQNLIQRRSDRKYQTVHAIRRRERSQRRAVLKKQVSMAVAQQLFYEHQQQKTLGIPLPHHHPLHVLSANLNNDIMPISGASEGLGLAPPIRVPKPSSIFLMENQNGTTSPLLLSFQAKSNHLDAVNTTLNKAVATTATTGDNDESSPTGIDDFTPNSFLGISVPSGAQSMLALKDSEICESRMGDNFGYMPIISCSGEKETWSDDDIELLQTILLN